MIPPDLWANVTEPVIDSGISAKRSSLTTFVSPGLSAICGAARQASVGTAGRRDTGEVKRAVEKVTVGVIVTELPVGFVATSSSSTGLDFSTVTVAGASDAPAGRTWISHPSIRSFGRIDSIAGPVALSLGGSSSTSVATNAAADHVIQEIS